MTSSVLVFGYGNPSRGDDALGPCLVDALQREFSGALADNIEFLIDFQLQIEHALDLKDRSLVLFADADVSCDPPFGFEPLGQARDDSYTTHAMSPSAVLQVFRQVCGAEPPPAFLLSIRGHHFGLGEDLGIGARQHLAASLEFCKDLLVHPEPGYWRRRCTRSKRAAANVA